MTICRKCGDYKVRDSQGSLICKSCRSKYQKRYREKHKDTLNDRARTYHYRNRNRLLELSRIRQKEKRDVYKVAKQKWREANKDKIAVDEKRRKEKLHPDYYIWIGLRQRCSNPRNKDYSRYGGRGIAVCEKWNQSFANFIEDMGPRPHPRELYSIDRKDNDGNYEPGNCRWATTSEQTKNRRTSIANRLGIPDESPIYYPFGVLTTLKEFSVSVDIPLLVVKYRAALKWDSYWIINGDDTDGRYHTYRGKKFAIPELVLISGIPEWTLRYRIIKKGWSVDEAINHDA